MTAEDLAARVAAVRARIQAVSPHPDRVRLVGVTKGFPSAAARSLLEAGVVDLGENYAQELVVKAAEVAEAGHAEDPTWHFLGAVQRNKIRALAPLVGWWHGVDRLEVGEGIARRRPGARILVQVNASQHPERPGVAWGEARELVEALRDLDLDVRGLMAVATQGDPGAASEEFDRLAALAHELALEELSMGMSDDLDEALAAGTTMVRVGRALLGERPRSAGPTE